jgi:FAD-linked sulfhydryl oxidase
MGFAEFYPCSYCKRDLKKELEICRVYWLEPINENSRETLSMSICKLHNEVNHKLGKPLFDCSIKNLDLRWKTGFEHC